MGPGDRLRDSHHGRDAVALELPVGHAEPRDPRVPEIVVLATVALQTWARGVEPEAVDLDGHACMRPVEVHLIASDTGVDERLGQAGGADQRKETLLGPRPEVVTQLPMLDELTASR